MKQREVTGKSEKRQSHQNSQGCRSFDESLDPFLAPHAQLVGLVVMAALCLAAAPWSHAPASSCAVLSQSPALIQL